MSSQGRFTRRSFLRTGLAATAGASLVPSAHAEVPPPSVAGGDLSAGHDRAAAAVRLRVNGASQEVSVSADEVLLDTLRERLGLTGAKRACGHGACGACTVLVGGEPRVSCLLPTSALSDAQITTVEGLAPDRDRLHPVQKAFLAHDALQCGYCTPGFVVEGRAFYDHWRATAGHRRPSREHVADAMEGHLCRCGAYASITAALQDACEGKFDGEERGAPPRVDGVEKVTGAAKYTVDVRLDGQLEAAVLRSPHPHARVTGVDVSAARSLPGVRAAVVYAGVGARIRYTGQEVVAVAAVDLETARQALGAVRVEYAVLPASLGVDAASAAGAPLVYDSGKVADREAVSAAEGAALPAPLVGNLRGPVQLPFANEKGARQRLAAARTAGTVVEGTWVAHTQCHTALEPHAAVARWTPEGGLEIHASTQSCADSADDLAEHYGLKRSQVRVRCPFVGGGFGAKAGMQMEYRIAADLAREAGAPVRFVTDRRDEMTVAGLRPGARLELSLGAAPDGSLAAMVGRSYQDTGVSVGSATMGMGRFIYASRFKDFEDYEILSHAPPAKPFRGPGGPAAHWAMEQAVDMMAEARSEDPLTLRRRWDPHPNRRRLYDWAEALPIWKGRAPTVGADTGRYRRGVGLAAGVWPSFVQLNSTITATASAEGITLASACQDMGNGSRSVVAWAAAEVLGVSPHDITVRFGDSNDPTGPMSGGSRTTPSMGPTARATAEALRTALLEAAEDHLGLTGVTPMAGGLRHDQGQLRWSELLARIPPVSVTTRRRRDPAGYYLPFGVQGIHIYETLQASVQVSAVEVDTHLGRARVLGSWTGMAVGRIWVPPMARTQVQGAVVQGISYALYEDWRLDGRTGVLLSSGLEAYRLAGIGDIPELEVHFDEAGFEGIEGGGVGLSELATVAVAASIGNAVYHATGHRPFDLPIRPDRLLGELS